MKKATGKTAKTDLPDPDRDRKTGCDVPEQMAIFASIVEHSDDAIIGKSLDGIIMSWNAGAAKIYGYPAHEAIGRHIGMLVPPGEEDDIGYILSRIQRGEPVLHYTTTRMRKDGLQIPVSLTVSPIKDRDGTLIGASTIARDITVQKQAEEALGKANAYNRSLIEASLDPLVTISPDGIISDVNEATIRVTGFSREELIGTDFSNYFTEPRKAKEGYERVFQDGSVTDYALGIRHRDGHVTPVLYNATVYRDASGTVIGVFASARDITEQRKYEEALGKANAYNRSLIEASIDPLVTINPDGIISDVNEATIRVTGFSREELIGTDFSNYFTEPKKAKAGYKRVFRDGSVTDYALGIRHRDGHVTPVLYNATVYRDASGAVIGVFASARDITERKKAEEELRKAKDLLEIRVKERTQELVKSNASLSTEIEERRKVGNTLRETSQYLENLINYANAPIIVWDPEFRITLFNRAFEHLTGRKAKEVLGQHMEILFPVSYLAPAMELIKKTHEGERWESVEIPILHRTGDIRTVLWNSAAIFGADCKTIVSTIAQGQDITDRKKIESEYRLRASEYAEMNVVLEEEVRQRKLSDTTLKKTLSLLNASLESTADGIFVVDQQGTITGYNQNFITMWNLPPLLLEPGKDGTLMKYVLPQLKDPEEFLASLDDLQNPSGRESFDMIEFCDGKIFERYSKPQKLGDQVVGRVWSFRDITDRKHAEEKLVASLKEKEVLLREIHHRVKNNLQLISGLLDMTRMRTGDEYTNSILTDMMLKIQTMAQIHTRLYESKQFGKISLTGQIADQITGLSNIYSLKGHEIRCEIHAEEVFLAVDQAIPCALVVNEILSNAYKHAFAGRKKGTIDISIVQEKDTIGITIRDDGIGLPENLDIGRTSSLGLKLIRTLVQHQLKGSLSFKNRKGTEVNVEFPVIPAGA